MKSSSLLRRLRISLGRTAAVLPVALLAFSPTPAPAQSSGKPLYETLTAEQAKALFPKADTERFNTPFHPNTHPGAQWYPKASFGLFIHWGIHSVAPVNPSWSMLSNCFGRKGPAKMPPKDYYAMAKRFDPQHYDPDKWMKMAKSIGMQYAVMTTKHHDGYCLWPTKYGKYNTRTCMHGRDLVADYVKACRANGLKVGFYYSPRDWSYNDHKSNFKQPAQHFDWAAEPQWPFSGEENEREYRKWLDYTIGQLSELLTRYGKIDVLWFDGAGWHGINHPEIDRQVRNWIYMIQPQIVINPRWGGKNINPDYKNHKGHHSLRDISRKIGDFYTYEAKWQEIEDRNEGLYAPIWFEFCQPWKGHWGHVPAKSPEPNQKSIRQIIYRLTVIRSFGGNYLLNVGPDRDGQLRPDIYNEAKIIARWMKHSNPALIGADGVKQWEKHSNVPLTRRGATLYAHLPDYSKKYKAPVRITGVDKPAKAVVLQTGATVPVKYDPEKRECTVEPTPDQLDPQKISTIIAIQFAKEQRLP